jgi:hypothetical protein
MLQKKITRFYTLATETKRPNLVLIYGSVISVDVSGIAYDAPVILKVLSEEDNTTWEVSVSPWCGGYTGSSSDRVIIRGEMNSSGKLNVCGKGTYIKIREYFEPKVDSIVTF